MSSRLFALDGGTLQITPRNGWRAFEMISAGNDPAGDGFSWVMPGSFDGLGTWLPEEATLRLLVNHETSDATISEVNLNLAGLQAAIHNIIGGGTTGGVSIVTSAQQAYGRWTNDGGTTWIDTSDVLTTSFYRFCSGQSYRPNTFGTDRGFVDDIYVTGEEGATVNRNRFFALDLTNRDLYQLSGVTGSANGGIGGMPADSWENAALIDTGETHHIALLLSPDGGTQRLQLYIGEKGKDTNGSASNSFLARNGLAYGSYYFLNDTLPTAGTSSDGYFDVTAAGALAAVKLEDVDTNPNQPTQVAIGVQESGLFRFDFSLDFSGGSFNAGGSGFSLTKVQQHHNDTDGAFGDADNVDWTEATTLAGVNYPQGLIFVNEDSGTANGEIWMNAPDGSGLTLIGDTVNFVTATETTGILDISRLVGYRPGSILLTNNQGTNSSLSALVHPEATLLADFNGDGNVDAADYTVWRDVLGQNGAGLPADGDASGEVDAGDFDLWRRDFGKGLASAGGGSRSSSTVPEPAPAATCWSAIALAMLRRAKPLSQSMSEL